MWELGYKKAEHRRTDAFELWCWRRLLRVPWTARRCNRSILKEIILNIHWKDWCWSWNSNTLATSCEELTHWKRPWCWERLKAEGRRRIGQQRMRSLEYITDSISLSNSWHEFEWTLGVGDGQGDLVHCSPWGPKELDTTERLNWTEPIYNSFWECFLS